MCLSTTLDELTLIFNKFIISQPDIPSIRKSPITVLENEEDPTSSASKIRKPSEVIINALAKSKTPTNHSSLSTLFSKSALKNNLSAIKTFRK